MTPNALSALAALIIVIGVLMCVVQNATMSGRRWRKSI